MIIPWRQKILRFLRKRAQQSSRELNNARAYTGFAWGLQFFSNEIWETCTMGKQWCCKMGTRVPDGQLYSLKYPRRYGAGCRSRLNPKKLLYINL